MQIAAHELRTAELLHYSFASWSDRDCDRADALAQRLPAIVLRRVLLADVSLFRKLSNAASG